MALEHNKAVVRRLYAALDGGPDVMEAVRADIFAPDAVSHFSGKPLDYAAHAQFDAMVAQAFPDRRYTVEDLVAEGDKVVVRFTTSGTHLGEFQGIPATGKIGTVTGIAICRVKDDKIVEQWVEFDQLGMLQELGVIPTAEHASA